MSAVGGQRRSIERQLRAQTGRRFKSGHTTPDSCDWSSSLFPGWPHKELACADCRGHRINQTPATSVPR
jgi:hypothetical protein